MKRDFVSFKDWSRDELNALLVRASELKKLRANMIPYTPLTGKTLAMIFEKSSTRTRVSFDAGMFQLGGHAITLSPNETQIGRGEPIKDTARVLSRYVEGIVIRTFSQERVEELASYATVPVINGLSDLLHPCQVLSDMMTVIERRSDYKGLKIAWVGDGNNMANSWIEAAGKFGFELTLACPRGFTPDAGILSEAHQNGCGKIRLTVDPYDAARDADVINTDVWASMGHETEREEREKVFRDYQINGDILRIARKDAIVLHCLPAYRGKEITDDIIERPGSAIWDQAENRLHTQKAIIETLLSSH